MLIGGKLLDHRLERSRISSVPTGERSFHILYYLLAGTSAAEKSHLGLDNQIHVATGGNVLHRAATIAHKKWRYLGHPTQLKAGINDGEGFQHFKTALRKLEFPRSEIAEICQILASILHLGQLEFMNAPSTTTGGDESGGYSHEGGESVTLIKNKEVLSVVAAFLGLSVLDLEATLGFKTKTIHRERVTVMLDQRGARANADELARTLYSLLVTYIIENINQRICAAEDSVVNTISIVDFPGFAQTASTGSTLDQLLNNAAAESLYNICLQSFFERDLDILESEEINVPATSYFDNSETVRGLLKKGNGLLSILDDQTRKNRTDTQFLESLRRRFDSKNPSITIGSSHTYMTGSNLAIPAGVAAFTVKHFAGEIDYPVNGLVEENGDLVSGDLMNMIKSTKSDFVKELFGQEALQTVTHPKERNAIMQAQLSSKPMRKPSTKRHGSVSPKRSLSRPITRQRQSEQEDSDDAASTFDRTQSTNKRGDLLPVPGSGAASQFVSSLNAINKNITSADVNPYFVFCLKPNDRRIANQFDSKCVRTQLQTFGIAEISQRLKSIDLSVFMPFGEFIGLAEFGYDVVASEMEKAQMTLDERRWPPNEACIGSTGVFMSERCWFELAKLGGRVGSHGGSPGYGDGYNPGGRLGPFGDSKANLPRGAEDIPSSYGDEGKLGYFDNKDFETRSEAGASAFNSGDMFKNFETREEMAAKGNKKKMEEVDDVVVSRSRKQWMAIVNLVTWFVPDFSIKWAGGMKRRDIRIAWREKLAINILIWLGCLFVVFFIIVFPQLICPTQHVYSAAELSSHDGKDGHNSFIAIRGNVFDLDAFMPSHYPSIVPESSLKKYAGIDATSLFPVQVSALCQGSDGKIDPTVLLDYTPTNISGSATVISSTDTNAQYHDFRYFTNDSRPDWFTEQMIMLKANYKKGYIGYTPQYVKTLAGKQESIAILNDKIYDFTTYVRGGRRAQSPPGQSVPDNVNVDFMNSQVVDLFQQHAGKDVTKDWEQLDLDDPERSKMQLCLDNLFFVGVKDTRNSAKCLFARYILLAVSIFLCSVIGFKFFAALQFGRKNLPENLDKFIICQVPAYTEDEDSLRRAIDSAARMRYDDKRKLLLVICDGMIIGQGNDRPTPRIVLDILGVSETVDPEPLSFESLGEGQRQHNMGKVYSGLYEVQGHIVPFLVVVKIGKPSEVSRPGNRGKRDSQMIIMRFLNRVHHNLPMNPLELEMHHQIRNIIGVNPTFYEFMLQIDADTLVAPDSATRFVSSFLADTRLIGVCGETSLHNAKSSYVTMIQVYEYYISHNLTKAFESLFGSVTCLPGCFSMYRIRSADSGKPLFVSREVVEGYSEIRVDTLHMKNLLHLGEDRYLTTLLLKHHPKFKTKYIFNSHAWTIAPDNWKVFLSQRRRWINSTIHNLMELIPLQQLCGFCCFSMRFIVFVDLLSTIVQPVTVFYIGYLIVLLITKPDVVPLTAFILLGAIYGLQAIIFILRRKWEMIGWMIIYILAMPVFSLGLPLFAFWHMDDFTWGNTRVVMGEKGRAVVISDEGKFDPSTIPKKRWEDYQAELWEASQTQSHYDDDRRSEFSGFESYVSKSHHPASEYGESRPNSILHVPWSSRNSIGGGIQMPRSEKASIADMEMSDLTGLPTDEAVLYEIRDILRTADLMTVTKKKVKLELERRFNVNLDSKRAYISSGKSTPHCSP